MYQVRVEPRGTLFDSLGFLGVRIGVVLTQKGTHAVVVAYVTFQDFINSAQESVLLLDLVACVLQKLGAHPTVR